MSHCVIAVIAVIADVREAIHRAADVPSVLGKAI
jgi:hypothetical protein